MSGYVLYLGKGKNNNQGCSLLSKIFEVMDELRSFKLPDEGRAGSSGHVISQGPACNSNVTCQCWLQRYPDRSALVLSGKTRAFYGIIRRFGFRFYGCDYMMESSSVRLYHIWLLTWRRTKLAHWQQRWECRVSVHALQLTRLSVLKSRTEASFKYFWGSKNTFSTRPARKWSVLRNCFFPFDIFVWNDL